MLRRQAQAQFKNPTGYNKESKVPIESDDRISELQYKPHSQYPVCGMKKEEQTVQWNNKVSDGEYRTKQQT